MRVTIRYFAAARERAGISSETLELDEAATAAEALAAACARHPALQPVAQGSAWRSTRSSPRRSANCVTAARSR